MIHRTRILDRGGVMIRSVGIDFHEGSNKVRCLDEGAQLCDGFTFEATLEGLATLEEHIFGDGSNPIIVFEPAGLAWFIPAIYLRARHPGCRLVKAKGQKVAALRRYLRGSVKSDRIDAVTLAKMPFVDPEQLDQVYLPPAEIQALQRLTRQRQRLESEVTTRKTRIGSIIDGYLPGVRQAFSNLWSSQGRAFLRSRLNPWTVVRGGEKALHTFLTKSRRSGKADAVESHLVYVACENAAALYELSRPAGAVNDAFFADLQEEIARELRLMEAAEAESEALARRIEELYQKLHPSDNLRTIPGVGTHTAPVFLATIGDPSRFRSQSALANWTGVVPGAKQSSNAEAKGLRMTKAGPAIMRWALYQAGQIGRRWDPQLACVYYQQMVHHGKNHRQAMGAVMSHLGARVFRVLLEDRPYELRDVEGKPINWKEATRLIQSEYQVPEEIKRQRRRRNPSKGNVSKQPKQRGMTAHRTNEAAIAPQPALASHPPEPAYLEVTRRSSYNPLSTPT
jgi:transposase